MNHFKRRLFTIASLAFVVGLTASCSKEKAPVNPTEPNTANLTQLDVSLSEPTLTRAANSEDADVMKTEFTGGDFFSFTYNAPENVVRVAYAHTTNGKSWIFRKTVETSSAVQPVHIALGNTGLKAAYLPLAAGGAMDGIVPGADNTVTCYDALQASGNAAISGASASASLRFTHTNHLLRFSVGGDASAADVNHLLLTLAYTDVTGKPLTAVLKTTLHTEYTIAAGNVQNVIQAIVPREAVLKGITAVFSSGKILVLNDPEHSPANLACPGGKSRLVALLVNNGQLTMQPGDISAGWADGGIIHSDGQLAGDIYINNTADLKAFRDAVNANPETPAGKINGIRAYMANVVQTTDIDLNGENWIPIGGAVYKDNNGDDITTYFAGTYNGNGYKISNMKVTSATLTGNGASHYAGLFGWVNSPEDRRAVLTGIHLRNASVDVNVGDNYTLYAGALVSSINGTARLPAVISLCSATGSISSSCTVGFIATGGLVGNADHVHMTRCSVNVPVTATGNSKTSVGGVVGSGRNLFVVSCYAQGAVNITQTTNSTANGGGIVGDLSDNSSLVMACRADGNVNAAGQDVNAGGLIGGGEGTLAGSFAKGIVTGNAIGTAYVGAIIGNNFSPNNFALCYGASADNEGTSRSAAPVANNIVYKVAPSAGEILSVINGSAWAAAHGGDNIKEAVRGGILTPVSLFASGQYTIHVQVRLWVLFDDFDGNSPWSTTSQGGTDVYPVPVMNYVGQ